MRTLKNLNALMRFAQSNSLVMILFFPEKCLMHYCTNLSFRSSQNNLPLQIRKYINYGIIGKSKNKSMTYVNNYKIFLFMMNKNDITFRVGKVIQNGPAR